MLGAIAFSGKAIIVKLAYRHGVDVVTLWVAAGTALVIAGIFVFTRALRRV